MWYSIEKTIKTWSLHQIERWMPQRLLTPDKVDWSSIRRILIVRQHDQYGDFLLTTPAIRALRQRFPDAYIALVIREYLSSVARGNPHVDKVLMFYESGWRWIPNSSLDFFKRLREHFDLVVVFNTVSHSFSSDVIACLSGAPLVLGPALPTFDYCESNPFYTLVAPVDPMPKHQVYRNLDVVRYIGADTDDVSYGFGLTDEEIQGGQQCLNHIFKQTDRQIIGVHFGTGDIKKRYPIPKLAALCDRLIESEYAHIFVIKAPDEDELLDELLTCTHHRLHVAPSLSLRQAAALLKSLDLLICNDTGVLHLAAAVGTPTISFHAISDPTLWKPINRRHIALYAPNGDITTIPVDRAIEAVERVLRGDAGHQDGIESTIIRCE